MADVTYAPGSVIRNRDRLWRVDAQLGDVLVATSIDGGETQQQQFYIPLEDIRPSRLEQPSREIVGHALAQDTPSPGPSPQPTARDGAPP